MSFHYGGIANSRRDLKSRELGLFVSFAAVLWYSLLVKHFFYSRLSLLSRSLRLRSYSSL